MIKLGYCRISKYNTKFFFQVDGRELEFYIERNPQDSTADLWINPGVQSADLDFIKAFINEANRAKTENDRPRKQFCDFCQDNESKYRLDSGDEVCEACANVHVAEMGSKIVRILEKN